ncbi:hypothetical protein CE91St46_16670 [Eubacteriales bacterium]|nr:HAMP domain-containing protein [Faecalicatena sp. BF-R-105]GKH50556.1 hypothetical protein CE91St46_16670 [Eubacteriales bacterium]GKH63278.1 hypothetical protein CE91St47_17470 [Eubacteriales bacterium]
MRRANTLILVLAFLTALGLTAYSRIRTGSEGIDGIAALEYASGQTLLARYQEDRILLDRIGKEGVSNAGISIRRSREGAFLSIADLAVEPDGQALLLLDLCDELTGERLRQEIWQYDLNRLFPRRVHRILLNTGDGAVRYRWLEASSGLAVLIACDEKETTMLREAYDLGTLLADGTMNLKGQRSYLLADREGVAQAMSVGAQVVYASRSGKLLCAAEDAAPRELYSALRLQKYSYPLFLAPESSESILMGVWESGDILSVSLDDGSTALLKGGTEPFSGISSYHPVDVRAMSMEDLQNFAAAVRYRSGFSLILCTGGDTEIIDGISEGLLSRAAALLFGFLGRLFLCALAGQLLFSFFYLVGSSRTILVKLIVSTLPLMAAALALFGVFSYRAYGQAITESFRKQAEDEGSLLTALFGTESFQEIEFPYQYTGEAYSYLKESMATRSIHTATAYYERGSLCIGVDANYPCAYPFDLRLDAAAAALYEQAAFTGRSQTGTINDAAGRRLACVTPIGGEQGDVVYLLETGILSANMQQYTGAYLRSYLIVSLAFLLSIGGILTVVFLRIVRPIGEIKSGLEEFAQGNRKIRLSDDATDEFSDIIRVFNKMANDIDAQIYSLQQANDTYFRFIPQKMLLLLGKENLGEIELGNHREQDCCVLCASLALHSESLTQLQEQELINRFFNIVNLACDQNGGVLITDSASLRRLRILCPDGSETAIRLALSALSQIDAYNATLPVQNRLDILFTAHCAANYYGICGDRERLIPALISDELDLISGCDEALRALSSRLLVTETAMEGIERENHFFRYIGCLEKPGCENLGLYDFYDAAPPEETRLINETRTAFDKAVELYRQGRYYDAKNLFALVLRQNQYDNVARHYIFRAERNL